MARISMEKYDADQHGEVRGEPAAPLVLVGERPRVDRVAEEGVDT
jgi:hypothetical protein